jgi:hypothetical protein
MPGSPLHQFNSIFKKKSLFLNKNNNKSSASNNSIMSEFEEPPLTPLKLKGYKESTKHRLLNIELAEGIRQHIPSILQISHHWQLLYSIEQSGTSLHTLYHNCEPKLAENINRRRGYILVVQDTRKNIFGAYLNDNLRVLDGKYYYGNGDCFLWKVEKGKIKHLNSTKTFDDIKNYKNGNLNKDEKEYKEYKEEEQEEEYYDDINLKVFPYTSLNDFIIYSNNDFISVGSGNGKFGLWIDSNLEIGASDSVETFGNEPLSDTRKFHILGLEVWKVC